MVIGAEGTIVVSVSHMLWVDWDCFSLSLVLVAI